MHLDLARAFTYAFEDKRWLRKLGVLFLIGLIPGLNLIAWVGYQQTVARNVLFSRTTPLPAWNDWGDILIRGLMTIVAGVAYFSPLLVVTCCTVVFGLAGGRDGGALLLSVRCLTFFIIAIYGSFAALLLSAGGVRYVRTDQYSSYFDVIGRLRDLFTHFGLYMPGFLVQMALLIVIIIIVPLSIITLIGPFLILTAFSVVNGHLIGQIARRVRT